MSIIGDTLNFPSLYLLSQALLGAKRARRRCIDEYARPEPGMRVLDIGCGPGYVIEYLPNVYYFGFDVNSSYIAYARRKYSHKGAFYCQRFDGNVAKDLGPFDLVLMAGLLHHLNDEELVSLLELSKGALTYKGKLVTLDPCYKHPQSRFAKFLLDQDRGESIRKASDYVRHASKLFAHVDSHIREDLFFVPYTALIMVCKP